jgi:glutamyl-tRNA synthetase
LDDHTEIISREDFIRHFDLDRIQKSPGIFNLEKLDWMNATYMRQMPVPELSRLLRDWLEHPEEDGGLPDQIERPIDIDYLQAIVPLVRERVKLLSDARDMLTFFFLPAGVEPDPTLLLGKEFAKDRDRAVLLLSEALVTAETVDDWNHETLEATFRGLAERLDARPRDLFMLMRVATTGRSVAPPLFETMELLGKERVVYRLREAANIL